MERELLNGHPKCTVIERFDGTVLLIGPEYTRDEFKSLKECKKVIERKEWEVNISFIKGSPIKRECMGWEG